MPETVDALPEGGAIWKWFNIMNDLETQGGLAGVIINPLSMSPHSCVGELGNNRFGITWVYNKFLLLSSAEHSQPLVDAFSKVVGYQPFCRYFRDGVVTIEWDKVDPLSRLQELQQITEIHDLTSL